MQREREAEAARQAVRLEALPVVAAIVRAVDTAVVLLPQTAWPLRVDEELVHALADLGERIVGHEVSGRALVHRRPACAVVFGAECARSRDPRVDRTVRRDLDRVAAHPAAAGLPALA
jgi:hypothetical protein